MLFEILWASFERLTAAVRSHKSTLHTWKCICQKGTKECVNFSIEKRENKMFKSELMYLLAHLCWETFWQRRHSCRRSSSSSFLHSICRLVRRYHLLNTRPFNILSLVSLCELYSFPLVYRWDLKDYLWNISERAWWTELWWPLAFKVVDESYLTHTHEFLCRGKALKKSETTKRNEINDWKWPLL